MTRVRSYPWFVLRWNELADDQRQGIRDMAATIRKSPAGALTVVSRAERTLKDAAEIRSAVTMAHEIEGLPIAVRRGLEENRRCSHCGRPLKILPPRDRRYCDRACKARGRRRRGVALAEDLYREGRRGRPFSGTRRRGERAR